MRNITSVEKQLHSKLAELFNYTRKLGVGRMKSKK